MDDPIDATIPPRFWTAVGNNDVGKEKQLLDRDSSLASRDFRAAKDRNSHTDGFPL